MSKINFLPLLLLALVFTLVTSATASMLPLKLPNSPIIPELEQVTNQNLPNPETKQNNLCVSQLPGAIEQIINQGNLNRSRLGILVTRLDTNQELYNLNGDRLLIPGSNLKLLTSAAMLWQLGANFRIRTSIYDRGNNSLIIVGRGDPSLDNTQLQNLGLQLRNQGRNNINILTGDDSYFQGTLFNPIWTQADLESGDAPPVNSLSVNQSYAYLNLIPQQIGEPLGLGWSDPLVANQWQVVNNSRTGNSGPGSSMQINFSPTQNIINISGELGADQAALRLGLSIREPSLYFMQRLRTELNSLGLVINQTRLRRGRSPLIISNTWQEIGAVESAPLAEMVKEINTNSNIFYVEMLSHQLGKMIAGDDRYWLATVENTLTNLGVDKRGYRLLDASGLARQNRVSPRAIVQTLSGMRRSPQAEAYYNSLALAGKTGTLRSRLLNTAAVGNFRGKSGTLRGVAALSGYLDTDYGQLVISVIANNPQQSIPELRLGVDRIIEQISRLNLCSN